MALRKLQTALASDQRKSVAALRKDARRAFKSLSPRRDADVLLESMESHGVAGDAPVRVHILKVPARDWKAACTSLRRAELQPGKEASALLLGASVRDEVGPPPERLPELLADLLDCDPGLRTEVGHQAGIAVKRL